MGAPPKTERSPWREDLDDALRIGDIKWAQGIISDVRKGMTKARWDIEKESLKRHIMDKQPIHALTGSKAANQDFFKWAKANASPYEIETAKRIYETYKHSARSINLGLEFKAPTVKEVNEFYRELRIKGQPTQYNPTH
jgi:hypothetical protein